MPVYNAGRFLGPAVKSIVCQTFPDWELLVIDDGSTDGAVDSIRDIGDVRIRILADGANRGLAARLNEAISLADTPFFARMDQDDIAYPERLAKQLALLEHDPGLDLVAARCLAIDEQDEAVGALPAAADPGGVCASPWRGFYLPHPTWMGRTAWFRQNRYATPGPYFCEDQELLLRSFRASRFACTREILFAYRIRSRIPWKKALRTRRVLLGIQLRNFLAAREWRNALMAAAAFLGRVALDTLNVALQRFNHRGFQRYHAVAATPEELRRWLAVRTVLRMPAATAGI